jgi:hypothetical protein
LDELLISSLTENNRIIKYFRNIGRFPFWGVVGAVMSDFEIGELHDI